MSIKIKKSNSTNATMVNHIVHSTNPFFLKISKSLSCPTHLQASLSLSLNPAIAAATMTPRAQPSLSRRPSLTLVQHCRTAPSAQKLPSKFSLSMIFLLKSFVWLLEKRWKKKSYDTAIYIYFNGAEFGFFFVWFYQLLV